MFPSFYISGWVMKVKASRAVEKEMTKVRSQFALPFSQFRTWGNLNFVDWVFCLLLGSTEGREHVCSWVLEPKIIWNPWMHRRFCLVLYPFHEPMICLFCKWLWCTCLLSVVTCFQISKFALTFLCWADPYRSWLWNLGAPIHFMFPLGVWTADKITNNCSELQVTHLD